MKNQSPQKPPNNYIKYSGMGFQMIAIIGLGCWGGYELDKIYPNKFHVFTVVLSLVSIFAALYFVLKDLIKPKE